MPVNLNSLPINDVNDIAHDRWQYHRTVDEVGSQWQEFDRVDRMVIAASMIFYEENDETGSNVDPLVPLSCGRIVNIKENKYFIHTRPKTWYPIRINLNVGANDNMSQSYGALGQQMLMNEGKRGSIVRKTKSKEPTNEAVTRGSDRHRRGKSKQIEKTEVQTSWIGTAWQERNPTVGNPSLNTIKKGLQDASVEELFATDNMTDNPYAEKAK